ncbi:WD40-repeat-containing domain protein [Xylaria bambusicola]|uniref:WD40-repeat-containing domain protein n=1 Tax=Xylaria bambusicola TaxID=326684 RepID=UPI002008371F|nr:WD40-repeat-containing domain protein [Xylaria bambusicola]KAI0517360.1 WD40-repeat-containing domain protein [Xylaria bambusicola]
MKIKALSGVESHLTAGSSAPKAPRNLDPAMHQFERGREYVQALNATKLERMFAKPFIAQLGNGHVDGVYTFAKDPNNLSRFASGSGDGVVKCWNLSSREEVWKTTAAENIVKSLAFTKDHKLLTASADSKIKIFDPENTPNEAPPIHTILGSHPYTSLSVHRDGRSFAAATDCICVHNLDQYTAAPEVLRWPTSGATISSVAFNQSETSVIASCSGDRNIILYDLRTSSPLGRTTLKFGLNKIVFNPMEPMNFVVASEDHNLYTFDMRSINRALNIYKGHVAAVLDVDFSPDGRGLISGSYDRTLRLWNRDEGSSRDIYHTKRMQRVFSVSWSPDANYVLSGSDDGNVRLWRANASKRQGVKSARHRQALEYNDALIERYGHMPEIRRIRRHRHIPKVVKKAGEIKQEELKAIKRRDENERKHTKKQFEKRQSERDKVVLAREK